MSAVPKKLLTPDSSTPFVTAHKRINLRAQKPQIAERISSEYQLSSIAGRILASRGFKPGKDLGDYLEPTLKSGLPHPSALTNLDSASELIIDFIAQGKAIAICCDFDVDGLSGGSQVVHFLRACGAEVGVFVPDRFEEGYGLNSDMVRSIASQGFGLLITIDFGTTNQAELEVARSLGLKTIVIDHHHVGDHRPSSDVFINPQQASCGFAGGVLSAAGLAWYLIAGLRPAFLKRNPGRDLPEARTYLDLACLGTICDMVPLRGPNRVIAKRGLELLGVTDRPGLLALKKMVGCKETVSCHEVSFGVGPRLNAAGRMVHGEIVIDLLTTDDRARADKVANTLNRLNAERQETELKVKDRAVEQLRKRYESVGLPAGLVAWDERFHTGVVGIVAQRLVEMFYRPSIVMGLDKAGIFKGSVRGIKGFSVVDALGAVKGELIKFGGHEGAGGFSVKAARVEPFIEAFISECEKRLKTLEISPVAEADAEVSLSDLSIKLVDELRRLAPFGMGNPSPQLLVRKLRVVDVRTLKSAHLKAILSDGKAKISGLMWRQPTHPALVVGAEVDVVFRPDVSTFNGKTEVQANLQAASSSK